MSNEHGMLFLFLENDRKCLSDYRSFCQGGKAPAKYPLQVEEIPISIFHILCHRCDDVTNCLLASSSSQNVKLQNPAVFFFSQKPLHHNILPSSTRAAKTSGFICVGWIEDRVREDEFSYRNICIYLWLGTHTLLVSVSFSSIALKEDCKEVHLVDLYSYLSTSYYNSIKR